MPLNEIAGYHLIKLIGTNGSEVWLAEKNGKQYAIKIPKMQVTKTMSREEIEEFIGKAEAWEKLSEKHENIVKVYEYGLKPFPYIVMEYCETNLREILRERGKLSVEESLEIALKVAEALEYAHHYGVVHRDIKPENILFQEGEPKIGDWGIAKILLKATTRTGYTGTPLYSAPEQLDP
ncbi:MAG: serine/threonine protein kinase, partial [Thermofilum sp. ex4484_82]